MALDPNCIFCKIIEGEIPAEIVYRDENVVAFNDLNPQAPTHVLLVPTLHVENAAAMAESSAVISAALFKAACQIGRGLIRVETQIGKCVHQGVDADMNFTEMLPR